MDKIRRLQNGSDVRGVAIEGEKGRTVDLTPPTVEAIAESFGEWVVERLEKEEKNGKVENVRVSLGRDHRISGSTLSLAVFAGLARARCLSFDMGLPTTPACFMSTLLPSFMYDASIMKVKTSVVKKNCFPVWNEILSLSLKDPNVPILLSVFDKDTFTRDDAMGDVEISVKPFLECLKMGLQDLPDGTKVDRVRPSRNNCHADESCIVWNKGKITQKMILRLRNVECGEIEIQLEWLDFPGFRSIEG